MTTRCPFSIIRNALKTGDSYLRWLLFPKQLLFPGLNSTQTLRIPGWESLYLVDDPKTLSRIHKETGRSLLGGAGNEFLSPLFGPQSVFLLDGKKHKVARRILSKGLSPGRIEANNDLIRSVVDEEIEHAKRMKSVNVGQWSRRLTMRIMSKFCWGETRPDDLHNLFNAFEKTTGILANFVSYNKSFWYSSRLLSVAGITKYYVGKIDSIINSMIANHQSGPSHQCFHILDHLLAEQDEHGYDNEFIRDNLVSVLGAGYDTTGAAISWMLFWLSRVSCADYHLLQSSHHNEKDSPLIRSFILESLRYCPPIDILPRRPVATKVENISEILDNPEWVTSDKNELPLICPFVHRVHHNADYFPRPEQFDMKRFLKITKRSNEFMPFGGGERLCLGMNLGLIILESVLTSLLTTDKRFVLKNHTFHPIRRNVSIWPGFRVMAQLQKVEA